MVKKKKPFVVHCGIEVIKEDPAKALRYYFTIQSFLLAIKERLEEQLRDGYWALNIKVHNLQAGVMMTILYTLVNNSCLYGYMASVVWVLPVFIAAVNSIMVIFVDARAHLWPGVAICGIIVAFSHSMFAFYGLFYHPPFLSRFTDVIPVSHFY